MPDTRRTGVYRPITFSAVGGNAITIGDIDAGAGDIQVTIVATDGTLTLSGTRGLRFVTGNGVADRRMVLLGSVDDVNAALDGMQLMPDPQFTGTAEVRITVSDLGNTGIGGPLTSESVVETQVRAIRYGTDPRPASSATSTSAWAAATSAMKWEPAPPLDLSALPEITLAEMSPTPAVRQVPRKKPSVPPEPETTEPVEDAGEADPEEQSPASDPLSGDPATPEADPNAASTRPAAARRHRGQDEPLPSDAAPPPAAERSPQPLERSVPHADPVASSEVGVTLTAYAGCSTWLRRAKHPKQRTPPPTHQCAP